MKHAIILGIGSDIGSDIARRLRADGWEVAGIHHNQPTSELPPWSWDLVVCCYGRLDPIGSFWDLLSSTWEQGVYANAFLPLRHVRQLYPRHNPGASVCFFSGAGSGGPAPTYSAYAAAKVMLIKMTELLDDESEDCKFFILGTGIVRTKIHDQTLRAGSERAANYTRVRDFVTGEEDYGRDLGNIYECLKACIAEPKEVVGGRNICAHRDDWKELWRLTHDPDAFRLRRDSDERLSRRLSSGPPLTEGLFKTNQKTPWASPGRKPSGPPPRPAPSPAVPKGG